MRMLLAIRRSLVALPMLAFPLFLPFCGGDPPPVTQKGGTSLNADCIQRCDFGYDLCVPADENSFHVCMCERTRSECLGKCGAWPIQMPRACGRN